MTKQAKDDEAAIREIAEKANPGWKAVEVARRAVPVGADAPKSDVQGLDLGALKSKYLGYAVDGGAKPSIRRNDDTHFVTMTPARASESPIRTRKAIVSGGKAIGFEG